MKPVQYPFKWIVCAVAITGIFITMQSCTAVKPYQRAYLNDANMQAGKMDIEKFDENMQTYREGASGGGSGKSSGGCGCN